MSAQWDDREEYVRGLLGDMRRSIGDLRDTEATHREVHAEYAAEAEDTEASRILARQLADGDVRVTTAVSQGAYYARRARTFALAYIAERDVDDRKARR